jgi:hypothetical protein
MSVFNQLPPPPVRVEYDRGRMRVTRHFTNPIEARRFYAAKLRAGKNPTVKRGE